jgi:hypothetical protein
MSSDRGGEAVPIFIYYLLARIFQWDMRGGTRARFSAARLVRTDLEKAWARHIGETPKVNTVLLLS